MAGHLPPRAVVHGANHERVRTHAQQADRAGVLRSTDGRPWWQYGRAGRGHRPLGIERGRDHAKGRLQSRDEGGHERIADGIGAWRPDRSDQSLYHGNIRPRIYGGVSDVPVVEHHSGVPGEWIAVCLRDAGVGPNRDRGARDDELGGRNGIAGLLFARAEDISAVWDGALEV